jgi:CRISPR-associated endonuclease/helicase Cas3
MKHSFTAHSKNEENQTHLLKDHILSTASLSGQFCKPFESEKIGKLLGLLHDFGKYHLEFQKYIHSPSGKCSVNHSGSGMFYMREKYKYFILALPVACHHSGLSSPAKLISRCKDDKEKKWYLESMNQAISDLPPMPDPNDIERCLPHFITNPGKTQHKMEFWIRMLFSALTDADFLDTESHFESNKTDLRNAVFPDFSELFTIFSEKHSKLVSGKTGKINDLRREIFNACIEASAEKPGFFRLSVPTGGGKTLSAFAFALKHCVNYSLNRIITAIPYTSIIEQTADVYRSVINPDCILEHHSSVDFSDTENKYSKTKLASENWDYPIIVTTFVQLFESLFAHKSSKCRKLHNIAGSVIILDEVQTLPVELLAPTMDVLQTLVDDYGVTIVLCTATQPALDESQDFSGLKNVREIIKDAGAYFHELKRVNYVMPEAKKTNSWDEIAQIMCEEEQVLCIVNTKKHASELVSALKNISFNTENIFHLSTSLCPAHRKKVIAEIKYRLRNNQPCRLVSTQIVEAGVDIDFPVVLRAAAPLDRIVQAAGRCNREGKLKIGKTIIFVPDDNSMPRGAYRAGYEEAMKILVSDQTDLNDPVIFKRYFQYLYQDIPLDGKKIQELRNELKFDEVADKYKIISDSGIPVIVMYQPASDLILEILNSLKYLKGSLRSAIRRLQPFTVNIYMNNIHLFSNKGLIEKLDESIYVWKGRYDSLFGIIETGMDPDSLIV